MLFSGSAAMLAAQLPAHANEKEAKSNVPQPSEHQPHLVLLQVWHD